MKNTCGGSRFSAKTDASSHVFLPSPVRDDRALRAVIFSILATTTVFTPDADTVLDAIALALIAEVGGRCLRRTEK